MEKPQRYYAKQNKPVTKDKYYTIPFTWNTKSNEIHRDRK